MRGLSWLYSRTHAWRFVKQLRILRCDASGELALQFEAVSQLPAEEQRVVMKVLESLIIKYQVRR